MAFEIKFDVFFNHHHHLYLHGVETAEEVTKQLDAILNRLNQLGADTMAAKQEILDAVAAEKEQVKAKLDEQTAKITELEERLASGGIISVEDLEEIKVGINAIFEPGEGVPPGEMPPSRS